MKKFFIIFLLLLLCSNVYAWESVEESPYQSVDIVALDHGFYTSSATVTGSVSAIPLYNIFEDRRSLAITNSDDYCSVYIVDSPDKDSVDAGYEILANSTFIMDIGDDASHSVVYILTSDSTVNVSVSTIEIR